MSNNFRLPNGFGSVSKLSGNRRKPYVVRIIDGYKIVHTKGKAYPNYKIIGYAKSRKEGINMLSNYHSNPYNLDTINLTFEDVFKEWSNEKFPTISKSNINGYNASFKSCISLHKKIFRNLKTIDLQRVIDSCDKNYPTLKKIKVLYNQLYKFAMKNDICNKDYSTYVDVAKHMNKNPNANDNKYFTKEEINKFWSLANDKYYQIILILIYTGVRIGELLELKKANINLEKQYFDVTISKTDNGIRRVPIADKVMPFFKNWYESSNIEYLLHTPEQMPFKYRNYRDSYFNPLLEPLGIKQTPHATRHTCISLLADAKVEPTIIKKIVGHSGAMSLTEKTYTHLDIQTLIDAVNQI